MILFRKLINKIGVRKEIEKFIQDQRQKLELLLKELPKIVGNELKSFTEFIFNRTK